MLSIYILPHGEWQYLAIIQTAGRAVCEFCSTGRKDENHETGAWDVNAMRRNAGPLPRPATAAVYVSAWMVFMTPTNYTIICHYWFKCQFVSADRGSSELHDILSIIPFYNKIPDKVPSIGLLLLLFKWTSNGFLPCGSGTTIRQHTKVHISQKMTHNVQTKHSTQSYTNNKAHITHNEYNTKQVKLSL
jgi:hypothetical protein